MSVVHKVLGSTAWQVSGRLLNAAISVVIIKLITSYLGGIEGYGEYTTVYELLAFFAIFADMGIYQIAIKEMSVHEDRIAYILGNIVGLRFFLVLLVSAIALVTVFLLPQYEGTRIVFGMCIATVTVMLTILHGTMTTVFQVRYKMLYPTITAVIGKLFMLGYMLFTIFYLTPYGYVTPYVGFYHLLFAGVVGNLFMFVSLRYLSKRFLSWKMRFDFVFWKEIFFKALPYGAALILNTIYFRVDIILLSLLRPDNLMQVGIYGVAVKVLEALSILPVYFMNSVLPILSDYVKRGDERLKSLIRYAFDFLAAVGAPMLIGGIVLAPQLIELVSTTKFLSNAHLGFYGSDMAFRILLFALFFSFFNTLLGYCLVAADKQIKLLWVNGACALFNVLSNILVISTFGFLGTAATSVLTEFLICVSLMILVTRFIDIEIIWSQQLRVFVAAMVMGIAVFFALPYAPGMLWLLLIPLGAIVYVGFLLLFRVVTPEMQQVLFGRKYF